MLAYDGLEYGGPLSILPQVGEIEPSDEVKKLMCLEFATRNTDNLDPINYAKEMYEWVKGNAQPPSLDGPKWDNNSSEVKYTYDLTGCRNDTTND